MDNQVSTVVKKWEDLTPQERSKEFENTLTKPAQLQKLRQTLPPQLDANYFIRSVLMTLYKTPGLLACTKPSLWGAIVQCGQLGLMPDSLFGEAHLLPYNRKIKEKRGSQWVNVGEVTECQLQIGYKGLRKLAMNSDLYKDIYAVAVYTGDTFREVLGTSRSIEHYRGANESDYKYDDPQWVYDNLTHVYAVAVNKDGTSNFITMTKAKIEARRKKSPSQIDWKTNDQLKKGKPAEKPIGVWMENYEKMAHKTGIRELAGQLSQATENLSRAVALDERFDILGKSQNNSMVLQDARVKEMGLVTDEELEQDIQFAEVIEQNEEEDIAQSVARQSNAARGAAATNEAMRKSGEARKQETEKVNQAREKAQELFSDPDEETLRKINNNEL